MKPGPIQEQWLQSLESHPERQTKNKLGVRISETDYKACCLGELAICAAKELSIPLEWDTSQLVVSGSRAALVDFKTFGLFSSLGHSRDRITDKLTLMNDSGKTWPEIAKVVRENFDQYFTKSY